MDLWDDYSVPEGLAGPATIRVLFVGTDEVLLDSLPGAVEDASSAIETLTVTTAAAAQQHLEDGDVDCLVTPQDLPDGEGVELLDVARYQEPSVPTLFYPDGAGDEIASAAIARGVVDYVPRGSERDAAGLLADRIERAVRTARARRTARRAFGALENAREGVSLLDENGVFLYVNDAYCDLAGYPRDELVGHHWETLYPPGHEERVYDEILPALKEHHRWEGETVYERGDGSRTLVSHTMAETADGDLICLVQEMGNRATERELQRERQRLDAFVDAVDEYAIFMLDSEGYITSWNAGAKAIKGYESDEILGEHYRTFFPEDVQATGRPEELLQRAREEGSIEDEGWRVTADGSLFWAHAVLTAVFEDGEHHGYVKVTEDRTDRRQLLETIESERAFFEDSLDALDDVFYVLDPDGSIRRVNERAVEATGYEAEELTEMHAVDVFDPADSDAVESALQTALDEGSDRTELGLQDRDGSVTPYEFKTSLLTDDAAEITGLVGIARDVSERIEREERIAVLDRVLRHNLRNKLTTIVGRGEEIRDSGADPDVQAAGADIVEEGLDLLDIAENARDFHELRATPPIAEPVDLAGLLADIVTEVADADPEIRVEVDVAELPGIDSDQRYLRVLFEHVLENAVEHNTAETPRVTVTGRRATDGPGEVVVEITDNGPGIPPAELAAIEAGDETQLSHGTGIGLFAIRWCAHALGGQVSFENTGTGTRVLVRL